ncbi:MAG: hypothetical protein M1503_03985 [Thaumarchaeota archaeon]|nr:hypothetical protein [Nitrososphaerota archaeon]MCL5317413.1 hypothetical protein [Nitrososphaerota archaeon]
MVKTPKPAVSVKGSPFFSPVYATVKKGSPEYIELNEAFDTIKADVLSGDKVAKGLWPEVYVEWGINNLYKFNLKGGRRLTYTIVAEESGYTAVILHYFRSHKEYEKLFGY